MWLVVCVFSACFVYVFSSLCTELTLSLLLSSSLSLALAKISRWREMRSSRSLVL